MKDSAFMDLISAQHGAFSRAQAGAAGYNRSATRSQVRQGRWHQVARNVFTLVGSPATWHQRLWCAVLEAGPAAVLSHRTAAQLLGVPGFTNNIVELTKRET